jgi:hypothetical protein
VNCFDRFHQKITLKKGQGGKDMTGKAMTVFLAAMFASQVALTAVSFAKGQSSSTVTHFKAKLAPPLGAPGECEGGAKYTKKVNNITLAAAETFTGEVECPILTDLVTAQDDVYDMHLARGGTDYAVCSLVIKEFEFEYQSNPLVPAGVDGEYGVNVGEKSPPTPPTLTTKVGGCTLPDLVTPAFPVVAAGDTVNVFLHPDTVTPLLTGIFVVSFGD